MPLPYTDTNDLMLPFSRGLVRRDTFKAGMS